MIINDGEHDNEQAIYILGWAKIGQERSKAGSVCVYIYCQYFIEIHEKIYILLFCDLLRNYTKDEPERMC